jgi:hypothetical protein
MAIFLFWKNKQNQAFTHRRWLSESKAFAGIQRKRIKKQIEFLAIFDTCIGFTSITILFSYCREFASFMRPSKTT